MENLIESRRAPGRSALAAVGVHVLLPVLTTLLSLLLHNLFRSVFTQNTLLIPLLFSVNLCAIVGGLAPGLLATALAVGAWLWAFYQEPPLGIIIPVDVVRLVLFAALGIVVSLLCGRLHHLLWRVQRDAAALRLKQERLNRAQQAARICTWEWVPGSRFMQGSEECCALHGLEPGAPITTERLVALVVPEDRERMEVIFRACERGAWTGHTEFGVVRGADLSMCAQAEQGPGGETTRLIGVTLDVTERKQMELAYAKWRPFFEAIGWATVRPTEAPVHDLPETPPEAVGGAGGAPVHPAAEVAALRRAGLLDLRPEAHLDRLTELTCRLLRVPMALASIIDEERLYFKSSHGLPASIVKQGQMPLAEAVCRYLLSIKGPLVINDTRTHPLVCEQEFSQLGVIAYLGVPLRTSDGKILGSLCAGDDRARTWSEDDLRLLQMMADAVIAEIEVRVALRQREEADAARARLEAQMREADRRKDEFLAMLAHELRNPLAPILNAVALLQRAGPAEPKVQEMRDVIARQVRHMSRLLDDLLDVSRFVRGKIQIRKEPLQLSAILRQAVEVSRPLIDGKGQGLEVSLPGEEDVRLLGDPARLVQVFANLLNNAAKYTGQGGRIWVQAEALDEYAVVRVRDSGMGMTPEMLTRAFELFTQADRSLDRSQGGLGIGLALARMLVIMHGGCISAKSEGPGRGSEFEVWLPRSGQAAAPAVVEGGAAAAPAEGMRRVLVVDDNTDVADTMKAVLESLGQRAWAVYGGEEALAVAEERRPEIVFLDIGLPGLDGYEVCRRLRHLPGMEGARIIAMTGYGQAEDRRRAQEAGFNMHLTKPVDIEQIERIVTEDIRGQARA